MLMSKIVKNYIYNSLYQVLAIVIPVITIPYVARVLGAEGVGINRICYFSKHNIYIYWTVWIRQICK